MRKLGLCKNTVFWIITLISSLGNLWWKRYQTCYIKFCLLMFIKKVIQYESVLSRLQKHILVDLKYSLDRVF